MHNKILNNTHQNISFQDSNRHGASFSQLPEPFNPKDYIMAGVNERDVLIYKEIFDTFDIDNNNLLTPMEIRNAMIKVGYNVKKQTIYQMLSELDVDESGYIDFYEFVKLMTQKQGDNETDDEVAEVFYEYDIQGKGYITIDDLIRKTKEMKDDTSEEDLQAMVDNIDTDNPGKITLKGWIKFMKTSQTKADFFGQTNNR